MKSSVLETFSEDRWVPGRVSAMCYAHVDGETHFHSVVAVGIVAMPSSGKGPDFLETGSA